MVLLEIHRSAVLAVSTVKMISTVMFATQTSSDMYSKMITVKELYVLKNAQQEHQQARIQMTV